MCEENNGIDPEEWCEVYGDAQEEALVREAFHEFVNHLYTEQERSIPNVHLM